MANDSYTQLNLASSSGDNMDESAITYGSSPTTRKRPRIVIGDDSGNLSPLLDTAPAGTEYAVVVRPIPAGVQTITGTVGLNDLISSNNSSTSTLTGGSTFTGTSDDVSSYSSVSVFVNSDQSSASSGLKIEWSSDASNWDITDGFTYAGGAGVSLQFAPQAQYFRIVYTNGGSNQGAFRLQSIYKSVPGLPVAPLGSPGYSAVTVQGASSGQPIPVTGSIALTSGLVTVTGPISVASGQISISSGNVLAGVLSGSISVSSGSLSVSSGNILAAIQSGTVSVSSGSLSVSSGNIATTSGNSYSNCWANSGTLTSVVVSGTTSGLTTIVAGLSGKAVHVFRAMLVCNTANNLNFSSVSSGNPGLTGPMSFNANGGFVWDYLNGEPWVVGVSSGGMGLYQTASGTINGLINYLQN